MRHSDKLMKPRKLTIQERMNSKKLRDLLTKVMIQVLRHKLNKTSKITRILSKVLLVHSSKLNKQKNKKSNKSLTLLILENNNVTKRRNKKETKLSMIWKALKWTKNPKLQN